MFPANATPLQHAPKLRTVCGLAALMSFGSSVAKSDREKDAMPRAGRWTCTAPARQARLACRAALLNRAILKGPQGKGAENKLVWFVRRGLYVRGFAGCSVLEVATSVHTQSGVVVLCPRLSTTLPALGQAKAHLLQQSEHFHVPYNFSSTHASLAVSSKPALVAI